ncbi:MAG TPA: zf-HC2 domain-containing protein [Gemmatimonadaceae bacterium]|nr:zf-HC2 domain-containing protein [Gemmatimonadaceae bacterium]
MTTPRDRDHEGQDRLSEYLDGLLTETETRSLEEHLRGCERCRSVLAELRVVVDRLHADPTDSVSSDAWPRIERQLGTRASSAPASYMIEARTLRRITAVASLLLTFAGGIWVGAVLYVAGPQWWPGWMHVGARQSTARPSPDLGSLRESLAAVNRELAAAETALTNQPATPGLQDAVQQLRRIQLRLQAVLDSLNTAQRMRDSQPATSKAPRAGQTP